MAVEPDDALAPAALDDALVAEADLPAAGKVPRKVPTARGVADLRSKILLRGF